LLPRLGGSLSLALLPLSVGCLDPQADYDAFVARAPAPDAQPPLNDAQVADPCTEVLAGHPSGTFYGACLTTANTGDVTQATYVKLDTVVTPNADGATGQLATKITSLQHNPTNVSQTVGVTSSPPAAPISAQCTYVLEAGTTVIPAAANSAQMDLVLSNTRYRGKLLTPDSSCTALDATITSPVMIDLTKGGNYCVFRRAPSDGSVTPFKIDDFACPGAPSAT
jgi:hypothetical protein